jgi:hypothetical protein
VPQEYSPDGNASEATEDSDVDLFVMLEGHINPCEQGDRLSVLGQGHPQDTTTDNTLMF